MRLPPCGRCKPRGFAMLGALALATLLAAGARAHTRSTSYSTWEVDGSRVRVVLRIPQLELTRLPWGVVSPSTRVPLAEPLARYLVGALRFEVGDSACALVDGPRALSSPPETALIEWELRCREGVPAPRTIISDLLREVAPGHLHFARVVSREGEGAEEMLLTDARRRWVLPGGREDAPAGVSETSGVGTFLAVGVEHIATGYDHLVFLLGLLLLARRLGEVVTIVTGFTLAHSLTLAVAALGALRPEPAAVEALIGLSIALVGVENGWLLGGRRRAIPTLAVAGLLGLAGLGFAGVGAIPGTTLAGLALFAACYFALLDLLGAPVRLRTAIAFAFGLIHGFGFAGVLLEVQLPRERLLPALLGFNLGVEAGQLVIVAAAWPLLVGLQRVRGGAVYRRLLELGTAAVCGLGLFWMVSRAYAP